MSRPQVTVRVDGRVACEHCLVADSVWARMRGLLGRSELPRGEGILLRPASSIHTFFMRFPIDAVFLDRDNRVLGVAADLAPWRVAGRRGSRSVLELGAGEATRLGFSPGAMVELGARTLPTPTRSASNRGGTARPLPKGGTP